MSYSTLTIFFPTSEKKKKKFKFEWTTVHVTAPYFSWLEEIQWGYLQQWIGALANKQRRMCVKKYPTGDLEMKHSSGWTILNIQLVK